MSTLTIIWRSEIGYLTKQDYCTILASPANRCTTLAPRACSRCTYYASNLRKLSSNVLHTSKSNEIWTLVSDTCRELEPRPFPIVQYFIPFASIMCSLMFPDLEARTRKRPLDDLSLTMGKHPAGFKCDFYDPKHRITLSRI